MNKIKIAFDDRSDMVVFELQYFFRNTLENTYWFQLNMRVKKIIEFYLLLYF